MNEKYQTESVKHKKHASESSFATHTCSFCATKFRNKKDLELHSRLHDKNKSFVCLLCKEVFPELKLLKLHDLRHSLEEAHEDMSDIDNWLTSLALSPCRVCGERFPCDEELVEHFVTSHNTVQNVNNGFVGEVSTDDLNSDSDDSSSEEQINYPLLREEIITKNGVMYIRFTLIDHPNVQVGEFTRMVEHKIKNKKRKMKSDVKPKKIPKLSDNKLNTKKNNLKSSSSNKMSHKVTNKKNQDEEIQVLSSTPKKSSTKVPKLQPNSLSTGTKRKRDSVGERSSDSDVQIVFENSEENKTPRFRHSKVLALKKKIWKSNPNVEQPKVCYFCPKSFITLEAYENHLLSHKKFNCKDCSHVFRSSTLLHQHRVLHHGEPKRNLYECEVCLKDFPTINKKKKHEKAHLNKQVQCSKCGREFKHQTHMRKHYCAYHIVCKICKCKFPRLYSLKRHLASVHKLKPDKLKKFLPVFSLNTTEAVSSNQVDQQLLDESSLESVAVPKNPLPNGKINEKKRVSLTSDINPVPDKKEKPVVNLKKKTLHAKNFKPTKVLPSRQVNRQSTLSNRIKIKSDKKNIVPKKKVTESVVKTPQKTAKNLSSLKQSSTKQFIPKKSIKKTIASVPYQSKGNNYRRAVKKLAVKKAMKKLAVNKAAKKLAINKAVKKLVVKKAVKNLVNKGKKKTVIDSKNSFNKKKKLPTPQKNKRGRPRKVK